MLRDLTEWFRDSTRLDGWFSTITGLGGTRDRSTSAQVGGVRILTDEQITNLYVGDGLGGTIVDAVPDDAIGVGPKTGVDALDKSIRRRRALIALSDAWKWGRAYGRGAVYVGLSDRLGAQDQPVSFEQIGPGDLAFVEAVDGKDLIPCGFDTDRRGYGYGIPTHYQIAHRSTRSLGIHASRFVLFGGATTPTSYRQALIWRDLSVLQRPYEALRAEGISHAGVVAAFQDLSQAVFKIKDLANMIANGQASIAQQRMEIVDLARSIARAVVLDADGESFEHVGAANLTGVDALLGRMLQRVAAFANIPATRLLGVSPVGMNATGESDLRIWFKRLDKERLDVEPMFERVFDAIARSEGIAWDCRILWPDHWEPTESERAAIESTQATADSVRIASGVIDAAEVAEVRFGGATYEEILEARKLGSPVADTDEPATLRPSAGETWIDTADQHRLRVAQVANGRVYFVDLDSSEPERQSAWAEPYFVERSRRLEEPAP